MGTADDAPVTPPAMRGRRVILWRHGETAHNAAGIWQGHLDTPLSRVGQAQADAAASALAALAPHHVVTSDLERAAATARALTAAAHAAGSPLVAEVEPRLREIAVGRWQGLTRAEAEQLTPGLSDALAHGEDVRRGGTGETFAELCQRVGQAVDEALSPVAPGEQLVVTTHGVAARAAAAHLLGLHPGDGWRLLASMGNCRWADLHETASGWQLRAWNVGVGESAEPVG